MPFLAIIDQLFTAFVTVTQLSTLESLFSSSESLFTDFESFVRNCHAAAGDAMYLPNSGERPRCRCGGRACRRCALPRTAKALSAVFAATDRSFTTFLAAATQLPNSESLFSSSESVFTGFESFFRNCYAVVGDVKHLPGSGG